MVSIAIIDTIGLVYDGDSLKKKGLGGSESAVILLSRELQKVGFSVTVFNNCLSSDPSTSEGVFDGVTYHDLRVLHTPNAFKFDIVISSRSVIPFIPERYWNSFNYPAAVFKQLKDNAKLKIIWMHDTFCSGDHILEEMVMEGHVDELFTLSDFHTSYVLNCDHGAKRNFEVLKRKTFITRNGAINYKPEVDVSKKQRNVFVYNASVSKGMVPLLEDVWPRIKQRIPEAKLKIIGGFYRFRDEIGPDEQEKKFWQLHDRPQNKDLNIEFTGIIKQSEIAEILSQAGFMLYPGAFPETFGISSLESLLYNTPIITCRFGALEETAIEQSSYFLDYAIEPNSLFTTINKKLQVEKFVELAVSAYNNPYLHQQKMYYCNIIKDIVGWDTIVLQWKQHFYKKLNLHLPVTDYRKIKQLNYKIHKIFGRRFSNREEWVEPKSGKEQHIAIISPFFNAEKYIELCINSVASQDYDNYTHYLIDDCSTDNTFHVALSAISNLPVEIRDRFKVIKNTANLGAVYNQITTIRKLTQDSIVMLLDGDDWLYFDNDIFDMYNNIYDENTDYTYGSCWSVVDSIPLISQPYPESVKQTKSYRDHQFNWGIPYTHLRTFRKSLLNSIDDSVFKDDDNNWFKAGGDVSTFYNVLEQADPNKIKVIQRIVYCYNDANPINDYKINSEQQTKNASLAKKKDEPVMKKKILIAIPCSKYIESETFKSIYDLEVPEGYETTFQYFYGYQIDQVRNLIASWAVHYDYLFSVDSDISFPKDTLKKFLQHDKDMVSGLYIQRKPGEHILEVYRKNEYGGFSNLTQKDITQHGLIQIDSCGFGCVLIKSKVISDIGYPQFVYRSALDHKDTFSEDLYFCLKAAEKGFKIYADTTVQCEHHGSSTFRVELPFINKTPKFDAKVIEYLHQVSTLDLLPEKHYNYITKMNVQPKIIYDIGACLLHWTKKAKTVWPNAQYFCFDALEVNGEIAKNKNVPFYVSVLSDADNKTVEFYQSYEHPGACSYYRQNEDVLAGSNDFFPESSKVLRQTDRLDTLVAKYNLPLPDLIKIDVQGAELDILRGAENTLKQVKDIIIELQHVEYNKGAPGKEIVQKYLESLEFKFVAQMVDQGPDGDYHFTRK
jgi:FkbM family methyltransferase